MDQGTLALSYAPGSDADSTLTPGQAEGTLGVSCAKSVGAEVRLPQSRALHKKVAEGRPQTRVPWAFLMIVIGAQYFGAPRVSWEA